MKCRKWPVGLCSWSLRTDVAGIAAAMKEIGLQHIHLAIRPAIQQNGDKYLADVRKQKLDITSTMIDFPQEDYSTLEAIKATGGIVPDEHWPANRDLFDKAVDATAGLGVKFISTHAGFIDETKKDYAKKICDRIKTLADTAAAKNLTLLLETGQETAHELRHFLEELNHPAVAVNFDPANMILYDKGNPIEALRTLAPWIRHVHVKDANRTKKLGTWGEEVLWGQGHVGPKAFLDTLEKIGFNGAMAIEREAGNDRLGDIKLAARVLANL